MKNMEKVKFDDYQLISEKQKEIKKLNQENLFIKKTKIFSFASKFSIYFLVFLLPIFFLPWTTNVLDFNKQALLLFLASISLVFWLIEKLIKGKIEINNIFLNLPILIFLLVGALGVVFSVYRYGSFWGASFSVSQSFVTILGFTILYFLIVNFFKKDEIVFLFLVFFFSSFLTNIIAIFHLYQKFILPFEFSKRISFNTVGSLNSLAIFNSILIVLMLPLLFFVKRFYKIILAVFVLASLIVLLIINFNFAWFVFLLGIIILFVFGLVNLKRLNSAIFTFTIMSFLVIGLFFSFFRVKLPGTPSLPVEVWISYGAEFDILKKLDFKDFTTGLAGLGNFVYKWLEKKPVDFNQTIFWNVRFGSGASELLDRLIATGIIGVLSFLFLIFVFLKNSLNYLIKRDDSERISEGANWFLLLGTIAAFCGATLTIFLYSFNNLTIWLLFWLLLAGLAVLQLDSLIQKKESFWGRKILEFSSSSTKTVGISFLFVIIIVLILALNFSYFQKYAGEIRYYQALNNFQKGQLDSAIDHMLKAINLNPKLDIYQRDLSQLYLLKANEILNKEDSNQADRAFQFQQAVSSAVNYANQATVLNSRDVSNWLVRALIYQNLIGFLQGADDWALRCYERAGELEPSNPYIFTEMGRIYLIKADLASQQGNNSAKEENINFANNYFEKAISLKPDYSPANYQRAMSYIREGKIQQAIEKLEALKVILPQDTGLAFQLGVIYYNNNQIDLAKQEFLRAIAVDPNYSNARYFLGLIYDKEGKKQEAISQFEIIEKFNPENQEVKKILSNLREGKPALEGIIPSQPPIQEKIPETLEK